MIVRDIMINKVVVEVNGKKGKFVYEYSWSINSVNNLIYRSIKISEIYKG